MKLAVPKESHAQETRVAISPETAKKFRALNLDVAIERGAGAHAGFADADYEAAGARLADGATVLLSGANLVLKVRAPTAEELSAMAPGHGARRDALALRCPGCGGGLCRGPGRRVRDGARAEDQPCADDGRPFVAGEPCGLQGGDRRLGGVPARDADDDDRGRHGAAGAGVRARGGGGGAAGRSRRRAASAPSSAPPTCVRR